MVDWLLILRLNPGFKWRLFVIMGWVWRSVLRCFELSDYALYVAAKDKQAPSLEQVLTHSTTPPPPPPTRCHDHHHQKLQDSLSRGSTTKRRPSFLSILKQRAINTINKTNFHLTEDGQKLVIISAQPPTSAQYIQNLISDQGAESNKYVKMNKEFYLLAKERQSFPWEGTQKLKPFYRCIFIPDFCFNYFFTK